MKFTDDDLAELRKHENALMRSFNIRGLINRMEAAEKVCDFARLVRSPQLADLVFAWLASKGEGGGE